MKVFLCEVSSDLYHRICRDVSGSCQGSGLVSVMQEIPGRLGSEVLTSDRSIRPD